jgi:hypothetical protein
VYDALLRQRYHLPVSCGSVTLGRRDNRRWFAARLRARRTAGSTARRAHARSRTSSPRPGPEESELDRVGALGPEALLGFGLDFFARLLSGAWAGAAAGGALAPAPESAAAAGAAAAVGAAITASASSVVIWDWVLTHPFALCAPLAGASAGGGLDVSV